MSESAPKPNMPSENEAYGEAQGLLQQMMSGPVDSERDAIANLLQGLSSGAITPEEVILKARRIEEERSSHYR